MAHAAGRAEVRRVLDENAARTRRRRADIPENGSSEISATPRPGEGSGNWRAKGNPTRAAAADLLTTGALAEADIEAIRESLIVSYDMLSALTALVYELERPPNHESSRPPMKAGEIMIL